MTGQSEIIILVALSTQQTHND